MTFARLRNEVRITASGEADLELVRSYLSGDGEAAGIFARRIRCVPLTLRALNVRAGRPLDDHDLADVVQDATLVLLRKLESFDGRAPLEAWAYRLCQLELYNAVRRRRRRPKPMDEESMEAVGIELPGSSESPADDAARGLSTLDAVERDIVTRKHFQGQTFEVIGAQLAISPNTAKTRYYRGLKKLQQFMEAHRGEHA